MNKKGILQTIIALVLVSLSIVILLFFLSSFTGGFMTSASFQVRCSFWVKFLKNIFSHVPMSAKRFFGFYPHLGGKLETVTGGWREFRETEELGDFMYKRAVSAWDCLNTPFPLLELREKNTLVTFRDFIKVDGKTKVGKLLNYINNSYGNRSEELKIGLIRNTESNVAKLMNPSYTLGEELPNNFSMEIIYSEWNVERDHNSPFKCASKEVEACYMPLSEREESFGLNENYYTKETPFQVLSEKRASWEPNPQDLGGWFNNYACEITDIDDLGSKFQTVGLFTPFAGPIIFQGIESLEDWSEVDAPCPYYKTSSCGYINKSLACCEDKIFICINAETGWEEQ